MATQVVLLEDGRIKASSDPLERLAVIEAKLAAIQSIAAQPVSGSPPARLSQLEQKWSDVAQVLSAP